MSRYTYLSNIGGQISPSTVYLRPDGTTTTNANDGLCWFERSGYSPVYLWGNFNGGTTTVQVESASEKRPDYTDSFGQSQPQVRHTTADVKAQLNAGVSVDPGAFRYFRVKIVQSSAATVSVALLVDSEG